MPLVRSFFELNKGRTLNVLQRMVDGVFDNNGQVVKLDPQFDPNNASRWITNPLSLIANDDQLWEAYTLIYPGKLTLTSFFQDLAICQFYVMDNLKGPEGDGARQMLRKHWYAWGKIALQPAAIRMGIGLKGGLPDSEALYDLMSTTLGDWNRDGLLEYRGVWVENNSTQIFLNDQVLPYPYDGIVICCEKDAAFNGVVVSGKAMGARAIYSGGGKSSRSGIEKLYYSSLQGLVRQGRTIYVLVISDWDTDGEAVIAPTFVEQLKTYIPSNQLSWTRVGIKPEQIEQFGYAIPDKWYQVKWDVSGQLNYLEWCATHGLFEYTCVCGHADIKVGAICPNCGTVMLPREINRPDPRDKVDMIWYKEQFQKFYQVYSPMGFELDALTRVDYCSLLVSGLSQLIDIDDLRNNLSEEQRPDSWNVAYQIRSQVESENNSLIAARDLKNKLNDWYSRKTNALDTRIEEIREEIRAAVQTLVNALDGDDRIYQDDPIVDADTLVDHMARVRQDTGRCTFCNTPTDQCANPTRHKAANYWVESKDPFGQIQRFQPFSADNRQTAWQEAVEDTYAEEIQDLKDQEYSYPSVDINLEE